MIQNKANLCILKNYSTIEELLSKELLFSKSFLKKTFAKNFLNKKVMSKDELYLPLDILNKGLINPIYSNQKIEKIFEDENFLVINKPFGIHGHPHTYLETDTVLNSIRSEYCYEHLTYFQESAESTLLYRLDKETSGVLIFAKSLELHNKCRENFSKIAKRKEYLAVVRGDFNKDGQHQHELTTFGPKGATMKATPCSGSGVTLEVEKIDYNEQENLSLVKVLLGRGVKHQIRCQLAQIGFPILGDILYGGSESERLFLHAHRYQLEFEGHQLDAIARPSDLFLRFFNLNSGL
ncbi:RNA pseudouridine synthase [Halobacteriovorax sp. HLS]|uniref:pseudouridine synthase family protein n=1 Tax=Halobacteriovorax sp. HLS TaxID=2234000 RepID=UPI000FD800E4|nr:RluA family pseudouridine synthase [Halobacteriovorax sp. HLS]